MSSEKKSKGGRPSKYLPEYEDQAFKFCLLGCDNRRLAELFDVALPTLEGWIANIPEFSLSLKKGRDWADSEIAASLYRKARGYKDEEGKYWPPDTTAQIFWLKNRQAYHWRDKQEVEHSGAVKLVVLDDEEEA